MDLASLIWIVPTVGLFFCVCLHFFGTRERERANRDNSEQTCSCGASSAYAGSRGQEHAPTCAARSSEHVDACSGGRSPPIVPPHPPEFPQTPYLAGQACVAAAAGKLAGACPTQRRPELLPPCGGIPAGQCACPSYYRPGGLRCSGIRYDSCKCVAGGEVTTNFTDTTPRDAGGTTSPVDPNKLSVDFRPRANSTSSCTSQETIELHMVTKPRKRRGSYTASSLPDPYPILGNLSPPPFTDRLDIPPPSYYESEHDRRRGRLNMQASTESCMPILMRSVDSEFAVPSDSSPRRNSYQSGVSSPRRDQRKGSAGDSFSGVPGVPGWKEGHDSVFWGQANAACTIEGLDGKETTF